MHITMSQLPAVIYLSSIGVKLFEERLVAQRETHAQICHDREIAHELSGDGWHDNPDFNRLQQLEANSTWKIKELEEILEMAKRYSFQEGERPTERVQVGAVVEIIMYDPVTDEPRPRVFEVVGYQESDPEQSCISYDAPLAKGILGLRKGDLCTIRLPQGEVDVELVSLFKSRAEAGLQTRQSS
jgi:transcription elongation GreA/GreB family factor